MRLPFSLPKVNHVVLIIITVLFLINVGMGLVAPVFAVFVTQDITGGSVAVVGFAITIYYLTKSVLQLFVARFIDRNHGEIDDFYFFVAGSILSAVVLLFYYFVTHVWHIYALHFAMGIADAMFVPPFYAIFTRHIDKGREGFEWALYSSFSLGAGTALGGAFGGLLGTIAGFRVVFLIDAIFVVIATIFLVFLMPYIRPKVSQEVPRIPVDAKRL